LNSRARINLHGNQPQETGMPASKVTIVVPGDDPPQVQNSPHLDRLRPYGEVRVYTDRPATLEEKVRRVRDAECILNSRGAVGWPAEALRQLPRLRMITTCGIGTDTLDLQAAKEQGVVICNIPGRTAPVVAEHALALLLATARRLAFSTSELKSGRWTRRDNIYLRGKTLGLLGAGSIAVEMARLGQAIGMKVIAWTFRPSSERAAHWGVPFVPFEELLETSDAVSIHLKLTDQSRGLLGEKELRRMKPGALLINTARGAIVDTAALVAALNSGHLGGAGFDVFDVEPLPPTYPLLACEQVVLAPHVADQNPEGCDLLNSGAVENIIAFLEGRSQNRVV
jgi:D-3-phosphoglycerate dehydrogenase